MSINRENEWLEEVTRLTGRCPGTCVVIFKNENTGLFTVVSTKSATMCQELLGDLLKSYGDSKYE